jgi:DUF1365 family protein
MTALDPLPRPARTSGAHCSAGQEIGRPRIYFASTSHRRNSNAPGAVTRTFSYSTCHWLVDVDDLPVLPRALRPFTRFEARDHLGDPDLPIADNARAALAEHGLSADRILLLTCPRVAGHVFNPLSVFYCFSTRAGDPRRADQRAADVTGGTGDAYFGRAGEDDPRGVGELVAVIAEVHNTYGGRHVYVLRPDESGKDTVGKQFYVSPFLPMGGTYLMRTPVPDEKLAVSIALRQGGQTPFVATLTGRGRQITTRSAVAALLRWPLLTLRTAALIRWQGIRLWLRKVPVQPRPADATLPENGR